jgi:hypothetical protein
MRQRRRAHINHVRSPEGLYPQSPTVRFCVCGSGSRQTGTPPPLTRTSCEPCSPTVPGADRVGIELRAALDDLGPEQHPALQTLWEPQMGANVFSRPQMQRDPIRFFSQVTDSQFDSGRR